MASTLDARATQSLTQVLRWPAEREEVQAARREGVPRLVLVDPGETPPSGHDVLEDWIRMPATDEDIQWRADVLELRARSRSEQPVLEPGGLLRVGERIAVLTPIEHRLVEVLVDRYRMVVSRDALFRAGWPDEEPNKNALDVQLVRLRRRLVEVGLRLRTVRQRGYLLDATEDA